MDAFCLWCTALYLVRSKLHTKFYKYEYVVFVLLITFLLNVYFSHFKPQSFSINGVSCHL